MNYINKIRKREKGFLIKTIILFLMQISFFFNSLLFGFSILLSKYDDEDSKINLTNIIIFYSSLEIVLFFICTFVVFLIEKWKKVYLWISMGSFILNGIVFVFLLVLKINVIVLVKRFIQNHNFFIEEYFSLRSGSKRYLEVLFLEIKAKIFSLFFFLFINKILIFVLLLLKTKI